MSDGLKYGEIKTQYKKFAASSQVMVDFAIDTKDGKKIKRVLSIVADPKITAADALNGEAVISGRVNYKVLYVGEDDEIVNLDYFADYKDKVEEKDITPSSRLTVDTSVIDIETGGGDNVTVSLVIENNVYIIVQDSIPVLESVPDGYFDERIKFSAQNYEDGVISSTEVSDEAATGDRVAKILMFDASAVVNDTSVGNGIITIDATVFANVFYMTVNGQFGNKQFMIPVKEEQQSAPGVDLCAHSRASLKSSKVVLTGTEDNNVIRVEMLVEFDTTVIVGSERDVIADVFSVTNEIAVTTKKLSAPRFLDSLTFRESVGGIVEIEENRPAVGEILGHVGAGNKLAAIKPSADKSVVNVEGVVELTALYRDADENVNSVNVEIPYSVSVKRPDTDENCKLEGVGTIGSVGIKRRRDRELDVTADLFFNIQVYGENTVRVVGEVEELETKKMLAAISVYNTAAGETLWDIAKELSVTPDEILKQNEELVVPVKNPGKVVIYRVLEG